MSKEKLVPRLKFGGFMKDEWISEKVSDLANTTYGGGTPTTSIIEYWKGDIPWISSSNLEENNIHNVTPSRYITKEAINNSATKLVPENSIAIVTRVGVGKLVLVPFEYTASQDFLSISNINGNELYSVYALYKLLQNVKNETQGTSIKGITKDKLLNKNIYIPTNIEEQIKIGTFFKKIDDMIQLQQSKLNKVKNIKSAYLSEMFPKEGEKYPKKRFEGFLRSWETCHLGQVAGINKGEQLNKEKMVRSGKYYVLNGGIEPSGYTNNYNTKEQTISISEGGNSCGYVNYNEEKFWSGGHNYVLTNPKINVLYLYYFLKSRQDEIMSLRVGSGLPNIQITALSEFDISYPLRYEQEKIGQFFRNLDNQISIEEEKLRKLRKLKQAYLIDMFV